MKNTLATLATLDRCPFLLDCCSAMTLARPWPKMTDPGQQGEPGFHTIWRLTLDYRGVTTECTQYTAKPLSREEMAEHIQHLFIGHRVRAFAPLAPENGAKNET